MSSEIVFKKLHLIKSNKPLIVNAPASFTCMLVGIDYQILAQPKEKYDYIQLFETSQKALEKLLVSVYKSAIHDCMFWVCYPKGGSKVKSDIKRDSVNEAFGLVGMQTVTNVSIDDTWTAMRGRPHDKVGK